MKAYKGFNLDMTCRDFKYEEGKTYEESEAILCEKGFHACINPINCLRYYTLHKSVYHEVELEDVVTDIILETETDTKICGKKITIGKELTIDDIVDISFSQIMKERENCRTICDSEFVNDRFVCCSTKNTSSKFINNAISTIFTKSKETINVGDGSNIVMCDSNISLVNVSLCTTIYNNHNFNIITNKGWYSIIVNMAPYVAINCTTAYCSIISNADCCKIKITSGTNIHTNGNGNCIHSPGTNNSISVKGNNTKLFVTGTNNVISVEGNDNRLFITGTNEFKVSEGTVVSLVTVFIDNGDTFADSRIIVAGENSEINPNLQYCYRNGRIVEMK